MRRKVYILFLCMIALGCEDYEIKLPEYRSKVVIEGFIEQDQFPVVFLTLSSGFFDPIDSLSLQDLVLTTARVSVSDGETTEVLTLFRDEDVFPPFHYGGTDLRGEIGKTYTLEVLSKGLRYYAQTTIPEPVAFDTLWFESLNDSDSLGNIFGKFTDNPDQEDFYRVFSRIEHKETQYTPVYQSVAGDKFFNGQSFTFSILKGTGSITDVSDKVFFTRGDSVNIKLCTIDKAHFDYWRTLERELYLTGNPFSSAGNEIHSNIEGDAPALGVWGGYGATYYRFIIP